MKLNLNAREPARYSMTQLLVNKFVPKIELYGALVLAVITYCFILVPFPPPNPGFLKDTCSHIATISANLWAIILAALVIVIPHIDRKKHHEALKRLSIIIPSLFLCMVLASAMYFYASFQQGAALVSVLALFPVICLFYYSLNVVFAATIQILKEYIEIPTVSWFHVSRKN